METYTLDTVPKGVPVQVLGGFEKYRPESKIAILRDVKDSGYPRADVNRRVAGDFLSKRTWIPVNVYAGSNQARFTQLPENVSKKVLRIHERYQRRHLGELARDFRP